MKPKILFLIISTFLIAWGNRGLVKDGNRYYAKGQYSKAIGKYKKAENSPIVYYNLGNAFYKQRKYKQAIETYRRVLVTENRDLQEKTYYNIGNARFRLGVPRLAISSYKKALRLNPNDSEAKYNLEYALRELKRIRQDSSSKSGDKGSSKKENPKANKKKQIKNRRARDEYQPQKNKMSKEEVKRVLNAIRKEEKGLQKRLLYHKLVEKRETTMEKDW